MRAVLPFGAYTPDQPGPKQGLAVAENVIAVANGYAPFPAFAVTANGTLPGYPLGAAAFRSSDGQTHALAGTASTLYRYRASGWESIGTGFSASGDNNWNFEQFGNRIICTNGVDKPVYYDTSDLGQVRVLPNAPRMRLLSVVLDFLVGGVVEGDVMRLQWSGINNSESWTFGVGQSDLNIAATGGAITGITGGEYGLVLQEKRTTRMRYVGGNFIFQFDPISNEYGCIHHRSVAKYGRITYYLSSQGFVACDGADVTPIGDEKVDRTFREAMSRAYFGKMSAVVDPVRKLVIWTLPEAEPSTWFVYSITLGRWTTVKAGARLLFPSLSRGVTLGEDVAPLPDDTLLEGGLPFGDPSFLGGDPFVAGFDASNRLGGFTGPPMAARLGMGPVALAGGREARLRLVRPVGDFPGGVTVRLETERRMGDVARGTAWSDLRPSGDVPVRVAARHLTPTLEIAAGVPWTFAQGLEAEYEAGARR